MNNYVLPYSIVLNIESFKQFIEKNGFSITQNHIIQSRCSEFRDDAVCCPWSSQSCQAVTTARSRSKKCAVSQTPLRTTYIRCSNFGDKCACCWVGIAELSYFLTRGKNQIVEKFIEKLKLYDDEM